MYDRDTMKLIWEHEIRLYGGVYRPLCMDYAQVQSPRGVVPNDPPLSFPERKEGVEKKVSDKPTLVMISDRKTGKIWFESSAKPR